MSQRRGYIMRNSFSKSKRPVHLLDIANEFLEKERKKIKSEIRNSTYRTYQIRMKNLISFLEEKKLTNITLERINLKFVDQLERHLLHDKRFSYDHTRRIISHLKQIINYAHLYEYTDKNTIQGYKLKRSKPKKLIYLSEQQLDRLMHYSFASPVLREIADLFKIQCWTGLAYSDLMNFSIKNLERDEDWNWINYSRFKNEECQATLPLFPEAEEILKKYSYQLPYYQNCKYNKYLKEVAEVIGFEQNLTTHVGRKTFGMIMLNNGVSLEVVSKMLGHKSIKTTQECYAKVLKKRVLKDMNQFYPRTSLHPCKLIVLR